MALGFAEGRRWGFLSPIIAILVVLVVFLSNDVRHQLDRLATASSDNVQWVLSQMEVEAMTLEAAINDVGGSDGPDLAKVRLAFDIFYSRVSTISESKVFSDLRKNDRIARDIKSIKTFLDGAVPLIDGPDQELAAALPKLATDIVPARAAVRDISLTGINIFSRISDQQRLSVSTTLIRIAFITAGLFLVLLVLLGVLIQLLRTTQKSAIRNRQISDRLETIISTSLDAVVVIDGEGTVLEYNGAAERIFGYPRSAAIGADMAELIIPDHLRKQHHNGMARFRQGAAPRVVGAGTVQVEAKRSNGDVFPIDLSLAAARRPEGEIYVGFMRDISDRVAAEKELLDARDQAIAGERSKANMLAVMSHEMRTPLNGMLGTLDLFETEKLDARHRRYLRVIQNSGNVLLGHVNDVLDISRLDADKMSLNRESFDLIELLQEVIDGQASAAQGHANKIRFKPPSPILHNVYSDPGRLRQIVINLLGNAIKFTRNGQITIEVECIRGLDEVEVRVIDNGVGIADEDLDRIFSDFFTVDTSYSRSNAGTGLGLGISQRLAKALGGELGAESVLGDGSIFWLRLPLAVPKDAGEQPKLLRRRSTDKVDGPAHRSDLPPLDILLVEDNAINRLVAREMLERDGHTVTEAHDGQEGVNLATRTAYDLILMDISMPGMDGVEATKIIRGLDNGSSRAPIIATTAHVLKDDIARFRAAGMNEVLSKPLSIKRLRDVLGSVIGAPAADFGGTAQFADAALEPIMDMEQVRAVAGTLSKEKFNGAILQMRDEVGAFFRTLPRQAKTPEEHGALAAEAHRLAGSAVVFGAARLAGYMRCLQTEAQGGDIEAISETAAEARECWIDTCNAYMQSEFVDQGKFEEL